MHTQEHFAPKNEILPPEHNFSHDSTGKAKISLNREAREREFD